MQMVPPSPRGPQLHRTPSPSRPGCWNGHWPPPTREVLRGTHRLPLSSSPRSHRMQELIRLDRTERQGSLDGQNQGSRWATCSRLLLRGKRESLTKQIQITREDEIGKRAGLSELSCHHRKHNSLWLLGASQDSVGRTLLGRGEAGCGHARHESFLHAECSREERQRYSRAWVPRVIKRQKVVTCT